MRPSTLSGVVFLGLGFVAPAAAAQQTAVEIMIPLIEDPKQYSSYKADVQTTMGEAVVAVIRNKKATGSPDDSDPTMTLGRHTFRYDRTDIVTQSGTTSEGFIESRECIFKGCPEPTTGSCTQKTGSAESLDHASWTLVASDFTFHSVPLVTPLPEELEDECQAGGEDGDSDEDDAAGRAAIPWLGLALALLLGFAV